MREILTHHEGGGHSDLLEIRAGAPGTGGAAHDYEVVMRHADHRGLKELLCTVRFQHGPVQECGVNGVSLPALLAIARDHLAGFQDGPYACSENGHALLCVEQAMQWLRIRTEHRLARGIEGTHQV